MINKISFHRKTSRSNKSCKLLTKLNQYYSLFLRWKQCYHAKTDVTT